MWTITEINNATHLVSLSHTDGRKTTVTIPEANRSSSTAKNAFLKSHTDAQPEILTTAIPYIKEEHVCKPLRSMKWVYVAAVALGTFIYIKFRGL